MKYTTGNEPIIHGESDDPLYPMRLYIYRVDGTYGPPELVHSESELGEKLRGSIKTAIQNGQEVRVTDPGDSLLFHAKEGKIFFDGKTHYPQGRAVRGKN